MISLPSKHHALDFTSCIPALLMINMPLAIAFSLSLDLPAVPPGSENVKRLQDCQGTAQERNYDYCKVDWVGSYRVLEWLA